MKKITKKEAMKKDKKINARNLENSLLEIERLAHEACLIIKYGFQPTNRPKFNGILPLYKKTFIAEIDDTTAHGMGHHDHSKHRVSVQGLTYEDAKKIEYYLNKVLN